MTTTFDQALPAGVKAPGILDRERIIATAGFNRWLVPPAALCIHLCIAVRQHFLAIQAHADIPYEQLRREMHKQNVVMPEIRAILTVSTPQRVVRVAGLEIVALERPLQPLDKMPYGFTVGLAEEDEEQGCSAYSMPESTIPPACAT
jgi:hypothetical protein